MKEFETVLRQFRNLHEFNRKVMMYRLSRPGGVGFRDEAEATDRKTQDSSGGSDGAGSAV